MIGYADTVYAVRVREGLLYEKGRRPASFSTLLYDVYGVRTEKWHRLTPGGNNWSIGNSSITLAHKKSVLYL